jgi:lipopolysaccharide/colanic/teichoic acid biosynthesis glycosyltransferase
MKRLFDVAISAGGLILMTPVLLFVILLIWLHDLHSPFYIAPRLGKNGQLFNMVKLRSMVVDADKSGVDSTSSSDPRITPIGHYVRKFKLDEFTQLWNVLKGDMSLVGPRPNVKRETDLYTKVEKGLLSVQPGITDFSSIVFSDENEMLKDSKDPDIDYNQLIRPWKSRLGLLYIENTSFKLDIVLLLLTIVNMYSRPNALRGLCTLLKKMDAPEDVISVSKRQSVLVPFPPPGADNIVKAR